MDNTSRDEDFYKNFYQVIDDILTIKPDFVIHSGDLFNSSKPSNKAISVAISGFLKLEKAGIKTVIIAGNHDTPRLSTTTHAFSIFENFENFKVVYKEKLEIFETEKINFVCLPHIYSEENFKEQFNKALEKINSKKINIFISHFGLQAQEYEEYTDEISGVNILVSELEKLKKFDYVALGHYHKNFCISKKICYSGSIEHTSFNAKDHKI
jgi:DNA repair exonuclease SbcCD nuclease subunit